MLLGVRKAGGSARAEPDDRMREDVVNGFDGSVIDGPIPADRR